MALSDMGAQWVGCLYFGVFRKRLCESGTLGLQAWLENSAEIAERDYRTALFSNESDSTCQVDC